MKTIIAYSGGLDSLGALYSHITTNPHTTHLVHHILLKGIKQREIPEKQQVTKVIEYLKTKYNIEYTESTIDLMKIPNKKFYDLELVGWLFGYICHTDSEITEVVVGLNKHDVSTGDYIYRYDRLHENFNIWTHNAKIKLPLINLNKQEILNTLPEDLKNMYWSCRYPNFIEDKITRTISAYSCGGCHACISLKSVDITHPENVLLKTG